LEEIPLKLMETIKGQELSGNSKDL